MVELKCRSFPFPVNKLLLCAAVKLAELLEESGYTLPSEESAHCCANS